MSRGRDAALVAADTAEHKGSAALVELLFASGPLRLNLGRWPITAEGNVYSPTGPLVEVEAQTETADGVEGISYTLTGLPAGIFDLVVNEPYQRKLVRLLEARFDANDQLVSAPTVENIGRIVSIVSRENQVERNWIVTLQTEHFDADARRAVNIRYSDAEQRRRYPDDAGAEYAASLVERVLTRTPAGG